MPTQSSSHGRGTVREIRERTYGQSPYKTIQPNSEPQRQFLATGADMALYGGSAGGGKTFAGLLECARWVNVPRYGAVFLRNTMPQIKRKGAAWDKSVEIYSGMGALPNLSERYWTFSSGATVKFDALAREEEIDRNWRDAQIPTLFIDQAEQFTESMILGMYARCRTDIGLKPTFRMGCNPDPDCWLRTLIEDYYLDKEGYAIWERSGHVRYFARIDDKIVWAGSREELIARHTSRRHRDIRPISFTFVPARLSDNVDLERDNPDYRAQLELLPWQEKMRLLGEGDRGGNWFVKIGSGMFQPQWWKIVEYAPERGPMVCYWDCANNDDEGKAATACVLGRKARDGIYVLDADEAHLSEGKRDAWMLHKAAVYKSLYGHVKHYFEQEGSGGGQRDARRNVRLFQGYEARIDPPRNDKVTRAGPWASYVENGNVYLVSGDWNKVYIDRHTAFPKGAKLDLIDASSGMFAKLADRTVGEGTGVEVGESTVETADTGSGNGMTETDYTQPQQW